MSPLLNSNSAADIAPQVGHNSLTILETRAASRVSALSFEAGLRTSARACRHPAVNTVESLRNPPWASACSSREPPVDRLPLLFATVQLIYKSARKIPPAHRMAPLLVPAASGLAM